MCEWCNKQFVKMSDRLVRTDETIDEWIDHWDYLVHRMAESEWEEEREIIQENIDTCPYWIIVSIEEAEELIDRWRETLHLYHHSDREKTERYIEDEISSLSQIRKYVNNRKDKK